MVTSVRDSKRVRQHSGGYYLASNEFLTKSAWQYWRLRLLIHLLQRKTAQ